MYNNLFTYATSELSQDAFICWLLSHAMKDCNSDSALSDCAKEFIRFFIKDLKNEDVYLSKPPEKQYKSIDVLITVNDKYKVIIEDKTHTADHDNQLIRYREIVQKDFDGYECIGVYYKTGFQSDLKNVSDAGYVICNRETILAILKKYITKIQNNIFLDYYNYLNEFDIRANNFKNSSVADWNWEQINGFYNYCQNNIDKDLKIGFGYVPNQTGGFWGMWLWNEIFINADGLNCEVYLQCEFTNGNLNICYRASSRNENNSNIKIQRKNRNALIWKNVNGNRENIAEKYNFRKPSRFGTGKSVALGVYNADISTYEDACSELKNAIDDFYKLVEEIKQQSKIMENML